MLKKLVLLILLVAAGRLGATENDTREIDRVMDAYHQAVVSHDGKALLHLFVPSGSAWFRVLSDDAYRQARMKSADAQKIQPGSVQAYADFITNSTAALDPRHDNVAIRTDGAIASVTFDFTYLIDGREVNRGSEAWELVKGSDGWRIVSVIFSAMPPQPK